MIYSSIERRKIASEQHLPASSGCFPHNPFHVETIFTNLDRSSIATSVSDSPRAYYGERLASHLARPYAAGRLCARNASTRRGHMDTDKTDNPIKEVLDSLFTLLESMETQNAAVLEFLKDHGLATDEKLAPYLNRAAS